MDDGDNEGLHTALHNDPRFLVATTLATLVVAGSAYIWRSHPRLLLLNSHQRGEHAHRDPDSERVTADNKSLGPDISTVGAVSSKETAAGAALAANDDLGNQGDAKDLKNSRPKERRRRGKDPLKEILKSGKKVKGLGKSSTAEDGGDGGIGPSTPFTQTREPTRFSHSREISLATSSRSVSTTSQSRHRPHLPHSDWASSQGGDDDDPPAPSSISAVSHSPGAGFQSSAFVRGSSDSLASGSSSRNSDPPLQPQTPEFPNISLSTSSSTSHSSSVFSSDSGLTPNTSPTLSLSGRTPTLAQAEALSSLLPHAPSDSISNSVSSPSIQQAQKAPGPWDWDGAGSSLSSDPVRKQPRIRSQSKGSGSRPVPPLPPTPTLSATPSSEPYFASSHENTRPTTSLTVSPRSTGSHDESPLPFTFPTLNAAPGPLSGPPVSPVPCRTVNSATSGGSRSGHNGNGHTYGNGNIPKQAPTPRCVPTSGTNTPPPSLSTQTQLASLRGALEAARMREEKTKIDMERYTKDLDMMRWENAAARRREVELQAQVHHLMHQLQTYATAFATVSGQPSPIPLHNQTGNPNINGSPNPTQNGYHFPPSPASGPHSPPTHLQIPSAAQMLGMLSPTMMSPMSVTHSGPHSPFYPYSSHSPHAHHSHPHLHQQSQPSHQPNLYSMMFPHAPGTSGTGSGPSSIAGSSSVGSHSPDLTGSPSPASASLVRGRRRRRTRTHTAGARIGDHGGVWEESEGNVAGAADESDVNGEQRMDDEYSDGSDGEQVNEFLADAILKRPESIRSLSSKKGKVKTRESEVQEQAELTFPSLSSFGNAVRHSVSVDVAKDEMIRTGDTEGLANFEDPDKTLEEITPPALAAPMTELLAQPHQEEDPH